MFWVLKNQLTTDMYGDEPIRLCTNNKYLNRVIAGLNYNWKVFV